MREIRYNRAIGVEDVFAASARANANKGNDVGNAYGKQWWEGILDKSDGWLNSVMSGIAGITAAKNPPETVDNTPRVLAIAGVGVAAVVLIIALLIIFKK